MISGPLLLVIVGTAQFPLYSDNVLCSRNIIPRQRSPSI